MSSKTEQRIDDINRTKAKRTRKHAVSETDRAILMHAKEKKDKIEI